jgi:hypothetical protein
MNDRDFEGWMRRLAADPVAPDPVAPAVLPPVSSDSGAIWWRAQLRDRMAARSRVTKPLRVAERLACAACLVGAAAMGAHMTAAGVAPFIAVMLAATGGAAAFVLRGAAE